MGEVAVNHRGPGRQRKDAGGVLPGASDWCAIVLCVDAAARAEGKRLPAMGFVELTTRADSADAQRTGEIEVVVGRRRVLVRRGFERELLAEVVGVLERMEGTA